MGDALDALGLGRYAAPLLALGYDDTAVLTQMLNDEFDEMCSLVHMLPGHRCKLSAAVRSGFSTSPRRGAYP